MLNNLVVKKGSHYEHHITLSSDDKECKIQTEFKHIVNAPWTQTITFYGRTWSHDPELVLVVDTQKLQAKTDNSIMPVTGLLVQRLVRLAEKYEANEIKHPYKLVSREPKPCTFQWNSTIERLYL